MGMEKDDIRVSVICITYNHEKYIRHAFEGFVNQKTNFKYEVLVHDDASTDKTADIIREYEEKYPDIIKPIYQTENQYSKHVKISQTYLYPKAKGEYFAYCEGDDYWCNENKLQKQYDMMQAHSECSMCICKAQCINEDGSENEQVIPNSRYITHDGYFSEYEIARAMWGNGGGYPFQTSTFFIRRDAIEGIIKGTLPYANSMNGDEAMLKSAMSNGGFYYIDEIMSCRRLMSVEGWTYRQMKLSEDEKRADLFKNLKADLLYDEYTNGRFHEWIMCSTANSLCVIGQSDITLMQQYIRELGISEKDVIKNCTAKNRLLLNIAKVSPKLFDFMLHTRNKFASESKK